MPLSWSKLGTDVVGDIFFFLGPAMALDPLEEASVKPPCVESTIEESQYLGHLTCSFTPPTTKISQSISDTDSNHSSIHERLCYRAPSIQQRDPCHTMN